MSVVSAVARIRERLWRERKEEYGYAFLLLEHHCLELCEDRMQGIVTQVDPARWFLNKFCHESERLRQVLRERGERFMLGHADSAHLISSVIRYQLALMEAFEDPHSKENEDAIDHMSSALIRIRSHMWSLLLPEGSYGPRPQYSYSNITYEPA